jgi:hypothetical protein
MTGRLQSLDIIWIRIFPLLSFSPPEAAANSRLFPSADQESPAFGRIQPPASERARTRPASLNGLPTGRTSKSQSSPSPPCRR